MIMMFSDVTGQDLDQSLDLRKAKRPLDNFVVNA